jgi:DHA1 family tetracycline resistance protein-like MFS transporter
LVLAGVGVASMIVQAGVVGPTVRRLGESRAAQLGLGLGALANVIYGLAATGAVFLAGIPLGAMFGLSYPSLQGLMTRQVAPDAQGRLQGAVASLMGIAGVAAPLLFTQTFGLAIGPWRNLGVPGLPFLLAAFLLGLAMLVVRACAAP